MMIPFNTQIEARGSSGIAVVLSEMSDAEALRLSQIFSNITPWSQYPFSVDELKCYLSTQEPGAPRYALRLADNGGEVVGALGLRENWLKGPYIQFLGLVPDNQNRNIGAAVLSTVENAVATGGARNLWVVASAFNHRALAFYQHFGFHPEANLDGLVAANQTEVLLRKRIMK